MMMPHMQHVPEDVLHTKERRSAEKSNKSHMAVINYTTNSNADTRNSRGPVSSRGPLR